MKRVLSFVFAVVISFCLAAGFAPASVAKAENIKVGAILAETGPSFLGVPEANTLRMLAEEFNAKGGINGNKVELIIKDSGGNPEKAISFAKQLIEEEKVFAIIGPSTSGETMQIKNIAEQAETILLSCAAAEVIVNPVAKWVFKTPQKDSDAVKMIFMEMNKMNISKIAVVAGNTGFGKAGKEQLEKIAPEFGIEVVMSEVYDKAATDLSAVVAKLMANKDIQAVINWSVVPAQSIIIKNIRQAGWNVPIFQSHGFGNIKFVQAAGEAAEGVIFPAGRLLVAEDLPDSNPQKELLVKYKNDYESKFKEEVSTFGGHAYDAFIILAKGIENAGMDKKKVRDAIENLKGVAGTAGVFNFSPEDHNGLDITSFEMLTVKDGKFAIYHK
jgi:branched-chain amino acid transport system substrate-binding protein